MSPHTHKALVASLVFGVLGIAGWLYTRIPDTTWPLLLLVYYATLVLNSFFSIRTFSAITPPHKIQFLFDGVLIVLYICLAISFGFVLGFASISALLFLTAMWKYHHLRTITVSTPLITRKIRLNALAALLSISCAIIALSGAHETAALILATVFAVANVYVLFINPMYRLN